MGNRILVIDDDSEARALSRRILEAEGFEVSELESAQRLERAICDFRPDLVLCDLLMPGQDGFAVCNSLRSDARTRSLPVILISAKNFEVDKRAALEAGAVRYLVKPIAPEALVEAVRSGLSQETSITIYGCRGSIPSPEKALGLYGGNTSCLDLTLPGNRHIILDAGTGIRALGNNLMSHSPTRIALCLTHFHWDHIFGLPFFTPLYVPGNEIYVYGPADSSESLTHKIQAEMGGDYFPVSTEAFRASVKVIGVLEQSFEALGVSVSAIYAFHPSRTLAYRVDLEGCSLVYAPDNEIVPESVEPHLTGQALRMAEFAKGATVLLHDCQYSRETYEKKREWGHSSPDCLAAVAAHAQVGRVLLFHHDPDNEDEEIQAIHREYEEALAKWGADIPSEPAREGTTLGLLD